MAVTAVEAKGVLVRGRFLRSQNREGSRQRDRARWNWERLKRVEANGVLVRRGSRGRAGLESGTRPLLLPVSQHDESQASFVAPAEDPERDFAGGVEDVISRGVART